MRKLFSTTDANQRDRIGVWEDFCNKRITTLDHKYLEAGPFSASVMGADLNNLLLTKLTYSNHIMSMTPRTIKDRDNKTDRLWINLVLSGSSHVTENGYTSIETAGDISIRDASAPLSLRYEGSAEILAVEVPRNSLEDLLGSARSFAGLTISGGLPTTSLARQFLNGLMEVADRLTPDAAERLTAVGIDLVVASVAERMAVDAPKAIHGTLTVQRSKAYIEANLGDTKLAPDMVAMAAGVSLRLLQRLFRERGRQVAQYIWERRLEAAAKRLSDPASLYLQIGEVAYGCGFADAAHFSRRFRERFGMNAREYRHAALQARSC